MTVGQVTPGWYPDPSNPAQLRWYDGARWTDAVHAVAPAAAPATAQPPQAPPQSAPQQTAALSAYQQAGQQQSAYQAPTYTQPQYGAQAAGEQLPANGCQICGAGPAMKVHLRGHRGMILIMRWLTYRGQYCRDCGTARFREVQSQTLLLGWWGYFSFVINTYNVFHNANQERQLRKLAAPQGRVRAPLAMGASVFKTPGFAVTLCLPVLLILLFAH